MNGAIAELWAKSISVPNASNTAIIGMSHQSFRSQRKARSSPMIPNRLPLPRRAVPILRVLSDQVIAEDQIIHAAPDERAVRLGWRVDDRLPLQVEGGVEEHGDAGRLSKAANQFVVSRTPF